MGGAQENTLITCKLLAQRGHDVTLITGPAIGPEGELFNEAIKQKYRVEVVEGLIRAIHPLKDILSYLEIKKLLKKLKPDIVHTHSAKAGILGRFAAHSMGNSKIVHTIHGLAFHRYQSEWLNKFYIAVEKSAGKRTDFFISVADAMTEQARAVGIGEGKKFCTAYSAIEEDDFLSPIAKSKRDEFRQKYDIAKDAVVLVTVARLFMLKGHEYIIKSAKELAGKFDNAVWLFVGDGNLNGHLKEQVRRFGLEDKIKFTGLLPPSQIPLVIGSSDILVHCSLREGLARTLPQGLLCGKPVISFDVDGAREVVNEKTGRLIEPKNVEQLISACTELISDRDLREELGRSGCESVKQRFSPEIMVDIIENVYKELLERKQNEKLS